MNKANVGDGIPVELFQIRKDDAVSTALNMPGNMENSVVATGLEMSVLLQSQGKAMPKNIETTAQWQSSLTLVNECPKFSQLGFKRLLTEKFQIFTLNLTKRNHRSNWKYPFYFRKSKRVPETYLLLFH